MAVLVVDLAHEFLEHVLERHQALGTAVFIEHDGELVFFLLEEFEEPIERHGLGHEECSMHDLAELDRPAHPVVPEHILQRHVAEDMVERPLVDGKSRVAGHRDGTDHLGRWRLDVEGIEVDSRPHDVAHAPLAEPQRLGRHRLLHRLEHSFRPSGLQQVLDVVDRHARLVLSVGAEQEEHRRGRDAHAPDERLGDPGEELHGGRDEAGKRLRPAEGQPFGHQFAEQQREEGEHRHEDGERDRFGHAGEARRAVGRDPGGNVAHQPVATVGRRQRADERDADLHRGEKLVGTRRQFERLPGRLVAVLGHLPQTAAPAGDDRHFGPGEKSVGEDERENNEEFLQHGRGAARQCGAGSRRITAILSRWTTSS